MVISIMTFSIIANTKSNATLSIMAEHCNSECRYAECRYAECRGENESVCDHQLPMYYING
jgi:hypothetical protein